MVQDYTVSTTPVSMDGCGSDLISDEASNSGRCDECLSISSPLARCRHPNERYSPHSLGNSVRPSNHLPIFPSSALETRVHNPCATRVLVSPPSPLSTTAERGCRPLITWPSTASPSQLRPLCHIMLDSIPAICSSAMLDYRVPESNHPQSQGPIAAIFSYMVLFLFKR